MREIVAKKQFKKDVKTIERSGRRIERLWETIGWLQAGETLPAHCRDHALTGNWKGYRECHLGGDWLLIYQMTADLLILVRTGSHSELFEKEAPLWKHRKRLFLSRP